MRLGSRGESPCHAVLHNQRFGRRGEAVGEDEAFVAAIRAQPTDDTLRLVYADWLDERDDPRGAFLRLEYRLHGMHEADPDYRKLQQQLGALGGPLDVRW